MTILDASLDIIHGNGPTSLVNGGLRKADDPVSCARPAATKTPLLNVFLQFYQELEAYQSGKAIQIDGQTLSVPAVFAAARYPSARVALSNDPTVRARVDRSRQLIDSKIAARKSIYGVSTGFGGSADARTDQYNTLGLAILQHQHIGILPSNLGKGGTENDSLDDSLTPNSLSMPSTWVRGAMLVRANSLIRGHSGIRWCLLESLVSLLEAGVVPIVPIRSSISASGDLSPLSYIAGTLMGFSNVFVRCPSSASSNHVLPASEALPRYGLKPLMLVAKEHLGMVNGTSFSASVGALLTFESVGAVVLSEVLTAMGTEALLGTQANYAAFISDIRPHPGQIEASSILYNLLHSSSFASPAEAHVDQVTIDQDAGELRQDRYPLRTAPQWIGPLIEDILSTVKTVEIELNSTTDNPLLDPATGQVHHGGNFQALSLTTAFEKTRLAIFLLGKILFAQSTELLNPAFNRGLPPNTAATDPSLNYHTKGLDIAMASYVSELGWLASHVATNVQSAEMHNQSVNSLALISGRATLNALEVLNMLLASYLYILCQALDIRALQQHFYDIFSLLIHEELSTHIGPFLATPDVSLPKLHSCVFAAIKASFESTTTMDIAPRLQIAVAACTVPIVDSLSSVSHSSADNGSPIDAIVSLRSFLAQRATLEYRNLQECFVTGTASAPSSRKASFRFNPKAPAAAYLGRTRPVYEFVRITLGIETHGLENWLGFASKGVDGERGVGRSISLIYEAIRDGRLQGLVANTIFGRTVLYE